MYHYTVKKINTEANNNTETNNNVRLFKDGTDSTTHSSQNLCIPLGTLFGLMHYI